ncbi:unnamed protein product [Adineta ricciae]|uniref:Uncharacterized protein n=1 Tax=Adineta ricciae TaxID=249248 RepID=A0A815T899_ADIRI|nr:unnamed protein product [Adineta ricciae]
MRTALNISARVIHDEVKSVYGDEAPEETEDKVRPDKPITETTIENIEQVRLLIDDDPHMATEYIQEQTDLRKITACYVPKDLTGLQQTEQVRICKQNLDQRGWVSVPSQADWSKGIK